MSENSPGDLRDPLPGKSSSCKGPRPYAVSQCGSYDPATYPVEYDEVYPSDSGNAEPYFACSDDEIAYYQTDHDDSDISIESYAESTGSYSDGEASFYQTDEENL
eukprot:Nk52_evm1s2512 gene=Nk52_evmTU1s2512